MYTPLQPKDLDAALRPESVKAIPVSLDELINEAPELAMTAPVQSLSTVAEKPVMPGLDTNVSPAMVASNTEQWSEPVQHNYFPKVRPQLPSFTVSPWMPPEPKKEQIGNRRTFGIGIKGQFNV